MNINDPCSGYLQQSIYWPPCRALVGGTPAMRAAGRTYLPQEPKESDIAYTNRLNRTNLFNVFSSACKSVTGKVLEKGIVINDSTPDAVKSLLEYVDESRRDMSRFIHDVLLDAVQIGRSHVLIDYPPRPEGLTSVADEVAAGLRPYWVHVKAEQLIHWTIVAGRLTEIRLHECINGVEQIRVITPNEWQIWQVRSNDGTWAMVSNGINTLGFVPLVTFYSRREAEMVSRPPLEDLAYKNIEHWQSSSDQRHILHVARVPVMFATGIDDNASFEIGPNQLIMGPTGSDLKYVEHTGAAIQSGADDLQRIEDQMAMLAMSPVLQSKSGSVTATERAIDSAEAQSSIKLLVRDTEDSIDLCLAYTAAWLGISKEAAGSVTLECDFGLSMQDAAGLQELSKARTMGDISRNAYLSELKRRGILSENYDIEEDAALTDTESPIDEQ